MGKSNGRYTEEFKSEVVSLVLSGAKTVQEVSGKHGIPRSSVYLWVRQARVDHGNGPPGALKTEERVELSRLRRELREVTRERDFLVKAAEYFASPKKKGSCS